jgi:hypothetical protein
MSDLDMFLAKTQAKLAFFLVIILVLLCAGVIAILLTSTNVNQTVSNLLVQVVTGVLALAGTACGFFYARTRQGGIPDSNVITQSHTAPDGTKTTITSPVNAPAAAVPVLQTSNTTSNQADKTTSSTGVTIAAAPLSQSPPTQEKKI